MRCSSQRKYENQADLERFDNGSLNVDTFRVDLEFKVVFLAGCVVRGCAYMCSLVHVCALYMNKGKEFGAIGEASERRTNGQCLGFIVVSWA